MKNTYFYVIEHSENKIIVQSGLFESTIEPGVLDCSQCLKNVCFVRLPKAQSRGH